MYEMIHIGKTEDNVTLVPAHTHAFWELIYVRVGTGALEIDKRSIPFGPGTVFLVRPGQVHYEHSGKGYGNFFLFFRQCFLSGEQPCYQLQDAAEQPLYEMLELLFKEFSQGRPSGDSVCLALMETVHQYVRSLLPNTSQNRYVEELKKEIENRFREPGYSPSVRMDQSPICMEHFRRLFVKSVGVTPLQYLIQLRVNYAKTLIEDWGSPRSYKQIAYASGWSDYYYFSRQFKQQTGFSPQEWGGLSPYSKKRGSRKRGK